MKFFKCSKCGREHECENNIKIVFCKSCLVEMNELKKGKRENGRENL